MTSSARKIFFPVSRKKARKGEKRRNKNDSVPPFLGYSHGCSAYFHLSAEERRCRQWRRLTELLRLKKSSVCLASYILIYPHLAAFGPFPLRPNGPKQPSSPDGPPPVATGSMSRAFAGFFFRILHDDPLALVLTGPLFFSFIVSYTHGQGVSNSQKNESRLLEIFSGPLPAVRLRKNRVIRAGLA
jgi:hypothetical protein